MPIVCARSQRVQEASEIRPEWLAGVKTVLLTSGASTPEYRLEEAIAWFRARGVRCFEALGEPEKMQRSVPEGFALPPALRAAIRRAEVERGTSLQPRSRAAQAWHGTEM